LARAPRNVCHDGVNVALVEDPKARGVAVTGQQVSIRRWVSHHYIYAQVAAFVTGRHAVILQAYEGCMLAAAQAAPARVDSAAIAGAGHDADDDERDRR